MKIGYRVGKVSATYYHTPDEPLPYLRWLRWLVIVPWASFSQAKG